MHDWARRWAEIEMRPEVLRGAVYWPCHGVADLLRSAEFLIPRHPAAAPICLEGTHNVMEF